MQKRLKSNGFTLMEMLIVVAIIAILVAIAIPTLTHSLESSRCAADNANIRSSLEKLIAEEFWGNSDDNDDVIVHVGIMKEDWDGTTDFRNLPLDDEIGWSKNQDVYLCWDGELDTGRAYIADKDGNEVSAAPVGSSISSPSPATASDT